MSPTLLAIIGISFIFLCTTLGSASVFLFGKKPVSDKVREIFLGFASGIMLSASIFSLILPAIESDSQTLPPVAIVSISIVAGAGFLWLIDRLLPHVHQNGEEEGLPAKNVKKTAKMFLAVTIHNVPEGLSVGVAYGVALASFTINQEQAVLGALMLAIGIGIQNIPEGAIVSLSYKGEGKSNLASFLYGTFSGAVEPIAALAGLFLAMQIQIITPWALAFAAGCMLYVIAEEMIPDMRGDSIHHHSVWAFIGGFVLMLVLDLCLG